MKQYKAEHFKKWLYLVHSCFLLFQVQSVWKSSKPTSIVSMFMKKNSKLTPFIAYQLIRAEESGFTTISYLRHRVPEPNCKPLSIPTVSLGPQKATFFALFLVIAYAAAVIIFGVENVWVRRNENSMT